MKRLRLDCIELYQLHRIDPGVPEEEQFGVLADLRREGKIQSVGLSEVGVEEITRARPVLPIAAIQNKYNLADRTWEDVVDYCEREGLAFIRWFRSPPAPLPRKARSNRSRAVMEPHRSRSR